MGAVTMAGPGETTPPDEGPPIRFASAADAVYWAEERAARENLDSQLAQFLRTPGGGDWTADELRDLALTITGRVRAVEPGIAGACFSCVYGQWSLIDVANITAELWPRLAANAHAASRERSELAAAVAVMMEDERRKFLFRRGLSLAQKAKLVGTNRHKLRRGGWPETLNAARELVRGYLDTADRQITEGLRARDLLR